MIEEPVDRGSIHRDLDQAVTVLHQLLADASPTDLRRKTDGTRWSNEQLLFHMLFGYLVVRTLLPMVRAFARLPPTGELRQKEAELRHERDQRQHRDL